MTKNFSALKAKLSPEAQTKVTQKTEQMLQKMPFQELPRERDLSPNNVDKDTAYSATGRGKN